MSGDEAESKFKSRYEGQTDDEDAAAEAAWQKKVDAAKDAEEEDDQEEGEGTWAPWTPPPLPPPVPERPPWYKGIGIVVQASLLHQKNGWHKPPRLSASPSMRRRTQRWLQHQRRLSGS